MSDWTTRHTPHQHPTGGSLPSADPGLDALYGFVWERAQDQARDAARRSDTPMHRFATGTLRTLTGLRENLDGASIGSTAARRYLHRHAEQYSHHPDFRSEWFLT